MTANLMNLILITGTLTTLVATRKVPFLIPCDKDHGDKTGPPLPVLPDQFETRIEANIVQKNYSTEVTEYYDYINNRGAIISHFRGKERHSILHFQTLERVTIFPFNNTCHVTNLTDGRFNIFNFTIDASGGHVKGVKDIFKFGSTFGEKHISGDERVRGIAVDHWQSCLKFEGANGSFSLDYYFSKKFYNTSSGNKQIPVRAVLNGTGPNWHSNGSGSLHDFYHIYDFFSFRSGPIRDNSVFEVPVGVFCNGSVRQKDMPKLPDQFTTGLEMTHLHTIGNTSFTVKSTEQVFFDFPSKLLRTDNSRPLSQGDYNRYGNRPVTFIHDFNTSLVYMIDKWEGNCSVRGENSTPGHGNPRGPSPMRRANELFNIMRGKFVYQGKKTWRGIPVESWAMYNKSSKRLQEIFYQDPSAVTEFASSPGNMPGPPSGGQQHGSGPRGGSGKGPGRGSGSGMRPPPAPQVIVGIFERSTVLNARGEENITSYSDFFGFEPGHPERNVFDVTACYEDGHHYSYMSVRTDGSYKVDVSNNQKEFYAAARAAIARGAGVSTTRVTSLLVEDAGSGSQIRIFFRLLDKLKVEGVTINGPSLKDAKTYLDVSVATGLNFDVQYPTIEKNFMMQASTLTELTSSTSVPQTSSQPKYGAGSMAGLGIGMLVVGAILGLLAAYVIYKKIDTSIPYKVTE